MAEIRLEHLRHSYAATPGSPADYALKGVDMVWEERLAYAVLGPSGSGKTTMLNILSGLLSPSEGRILFDGRDVTRLGSRERNIAQVFQFPVVYETMTVDENLAFPLRTRKLEPARVEARVRFIAEELGLTPLLRRKARALTAGQKQRISLGRGLVREDVAAILLDEPLTVIDPAEKLMLRRTLKSMQAHLGVKLIYVTHDQHEAMTLADQIVVMNEGAVVQTGTPRDLFERPQHRFVGYFIGTPGMNFLECEVGQGGVHAGGGFVRLGPGTLAALARARGKLRLGIRPDFVHPVDRMDDGVFSGTLAEIQSHGDERILAIDTGADRLMVRDTGTSALAPGLTVHVGVDRDFLSFFDDDIAIQTAPGSAGAAR